MYPFGQEVLFGFAGWDLLKITDTSQLCLGSGKG